MNIKVLDEKLWNSSWLNNSLSLVDLVHVSRLLLGLVYWLMRYLEILSVWCGILGSLGGLKMKIRREKLEVSSFTPWGAAPPRALQGRLYLIGPSTAHHPERLWPEYVLQNCRYAPVKTPRPSGDPVLSLSFCMSSEVMYLSSLVDSKTLKYI